MIEFNGFQVGINSGKIMRECIMGPLVWPAVPEPIFPECGRVVFRSYVEEYPHMPRIVEVLSIATNPMSHVSQCHGEMRNGLQYQLPLFESLNTSPQAIQSTRKVCSDLTPSDHIECIKGRFSNGAPKGQQLRDALGLLPTPDIIIIVFGQGNSMVRIRLKIIQKDAVCSRGDLKTTLAFANSQLQSAFIGGVRGSIDPFPKSISASVISESPSVNHISQYRLLPTCRGRRGRPVGQPLRERRTRRAPVFGPLLLRRPRGPRRDWPHGPGFGDRTAQLGNLFYRGRGAP